MHRYRRRINLIYLKRFLKLCENTFSNRCLVPTCPHEYLSATAFLSNSSIICKAYNQIHSRDVNAPVINFNDVDCIPPCTCVFINGNHARMNSESKASVAKQRKSLNALENTPCIIQTIKNRHLQARVLFFFDSRIWSLQLTSHTKMRNNYCPRVRKIRCISAILMIFLFRLQLK